MPFLTYRQTRPWAKAIREAVLLKKMPPWFADPHYGKFANDPSLTTEQIQMLVAWADSGAVPGDPDDRPPPRRWIDGWNITKPDTVFQMPASFQVPADGDIEYQYVVVPTHFTEDRWVQMAEIRPTFRAAVHHAVVYVREPGSSWLRSAKPGVVFSAKDLPTEQERREAGQTTTDILLVYTPGSVPDQWPARYGKLIKAGSDLVFQIHYTATGKAGSDQTSIGLVFSKESPQKRILSLQMNNSHFLIPPGHPDFQIPVSGTLPNDAELLSFFPHMHLRGKAFEYNILHPDGHTETLLKVNHYDFHWQLTYRLAEPRQLSAGTRLQCIGYYDNSRNNPRNPDPDSAVTFGEQSWQEMMVGFFDIAVDPAIDKQTFFIRKRPGAGK